MTKNVDRSGRLNCTECSKTQNVGRSLFPTGDDSICGFDASSAKDAVRRRRRHHRKFKKGIVGMPRLFCS